MVGPHTLGIEFDIMAALGEGMLPIFKMISRPGILIRHRTTTKKSGHGMWRSLRDPSSDTVVPTGLVAVVLKYLLNNPAVVITGKMNSEKLYTFLEKLYSSPSFSLNQLPGRRRVDPKFGSVRLDSKHRNS